MKYLSLLFCLLSFSIFSQKKTFYKDSYLKELILAEKKAGLKKMHFQNNANTTNYDVKYHRLVWNVDPTKAHISGHVTTHFIANMNMNKIVFDMANNLTVSSVTQRGANLPFTTNSNDELIITLPSTQSSGTLDSLTVTYSGNPVSSGFGSFEVGTHNGTPVLWTLSEPYGAKGWWPCKQDLNDKIDVIDVYINAPSEYTAVSNGLLKSEVTSGTTKTTHWRHEYKIPAYLIAIAVTNYSKYSHHVANGNFSIDNYVYPESLILAQSQTPVTVDIMNLFGDLFEIYPFANEKYGHAQFGWGGGMEHTTISFMGNFSRGLIAHELAHQWFGNKITCGSWEDIWLNEGFATYLTGLTVENLDGKEAFINWKKRKTSSITSQSSGSVFCTDTTSIGRIFSSRLSYNKGAMLVHMLRYKLGDTDFFNGIKAYLQDPELAYGYAKTYQLKQHLETASGQNLTEFFNDWYTGEGYPSYQIQADNYGKSIRITVHQTPSHNSVSFFEMPLTFKVVGTNGEEEVFKVAHTSNGQVFNHTTSFDISTLIFDPESDIISKSNNLTLGVKNEVLDNTISIFPNPAKETFKIITGNITKIEKLSIYNALGQVIFESINPKTKNINIKNLQQGTYFVKITTEKGTISKTLLKEK